MPLAVPAPTNTRPPSQGGARPRQSAGSTQPPVTPGAPPSNTPVRPVFAPGTSDPNFFGQQDRAATGFAGRFFGGIQQAFTGSQSVSDTNYDTYVKKFGQSEVDKVKAAGVDPQVYFNPMTSNVMKQQMLGWGGNLTSGAARGIGEQQVAQTGRNNAQVDLFGDFMQSQGSSLIGQYDQGMASAQGRYDYGRGVLEQGAYTDRALLDQRQFRDVDLARQNTGIDQNYLGTMRDVAGQQYGIAQQRFGDEQKHINDMIGQMNARQTTAFNRFNTNQAFLGQQAADNAQQYGFTSRAFDQDVRGNMLQRETSKRAATSDAAARGAFGSAGFGDNIDDIMAQYGLSQEQAGLALDRANQQTDERDRGIGNDRKNLGFSYEDQQAGFREQGFGFDRAHQGNIRTAEGDKQQFRGQMAGFDRDRDKLSNVNAGLDSLAKEYGIKRGDIENQFKNAVTGMGLDFADTQTKLEQMMNSGNAALAQQAIAFQQQMMGFQ